MNIQTVKKPRFISKGGTEIKIIEAKTYSMAAQELSRRATRSGSDDLSISPSTPTDSL
jgi:hypothetical protein